MIRIRLKAPCTGIAIGIIWFSQICLLTWYYPKWSFSGYEMITAYDVAGYYMYLPALFIYDDLGGDSYHDAVREATLQPGAWDYGFRHDPSGNFVMKYPLGQALQFAPFFAVAHMYASHSDAYPTNGFSLPYQIGLAVEILTVALVGLLLLQSLLLRYFPDDIVAWTLLGVGLGTNYLEYSSLTGGLTHNNLFAMYAALALASGSYHKRPSRILAAGMGLLVGLATLTRPTEVLCALIPLLWGIRPTLPGLRERLTFLSANRGHLLVAAVATAAVVALQLLYWRAISGEWVVYSYQDQGFSFLSPHLLEGLLSARAGWLPYTPMGALMVAGLIALWRGGGAAAALAPGICAYLLAFCYVAWSWDIWWYGGSLGQRAMVQAYPLLAFGLAAGLASATTLRPLLRMGLAGLFALCIAVNLFWTHQAHHGGNLRAGQMTWRYYLATVGRFDHDAEREKLLDQSRLYRGRLLDPELVLASGYEAMDPALTCPGPAISGERSPCIRRESDAPPRLSAPLAPDPATPRWVRASATVDVRVKTWEWWAMAQFIVRFLRVDGAGETREVGALMIRPERLLDGGRARVHLDGPVPDGELDSVVVEWWKPGLVGELLVDDVEVVTYRPEADRAGW